MKIISVISTENIYVGEPQIRLLFAQKYEKRVLCRSYFEYHFLKNTIQVHRNRCIFRAGYADIFNYYSNIFNNISYFKQISNGLTNKK